MKNKSEAFVLLKLMHNFHESSIIINQEAISFHDLITCQMRALSIDKVVLHYNPSDADGKRVSHVHYAESLARF